MLPLCFSHHQNFGTADSGYSSPMSTIQPQKLHKEDSITQALIDLAIDNSLDDSIVRPLPGTDLAVPDHGTQLPYPETSAPARLLTCVPYYEANSSVPATQSYEYLPTASAEALVGDREPLSSHLNRAVKDLRWTFPEFRQYRKIAADGHCFYRAFACSVLEGLLEPSAAVEAYTLHRCEAVMPASGTINRLPILTHPHEAIARLPLSHRAMYSLSIFSSCYLQAHCSTSRPSAW